jgi:hypothetical protein
MLVSVGKGANVLQHELYFQWIGFNGTGCLPSNDLLQCHFSHTLLFDEFLALVMSCASTHAMQYSCSPGMFKTPNSGLTYLDRQESTLGAYKTHTLDPILFQNGMKLVIRNNERTNDCADVMDCCPRLFDPSHNSNHMGVNSSSNGGNPYHYAFNESQLAMDLARRAKELQQHPVRVTRSGSSSASQKPTKPVVYSGLVWFYDWDSSDTHPVDELKAARPTRTTGTTPGPKKREGIVATSLSRIAELSTLSLITSTEEDAAVDRLLEHDTKLELLLQGLGATHHQQQLARQVRRYLQR